MPRRKSRKSKKAKRIKSLQTDFFYGVGAVSGAKTLYINAAHCLSMMNRKAFHQVHSDGSIKHYGLQVSVFNMVNGSTNIITARLGYPLENATRAWHFVRKDRFKDAGFKLSDLGYGARMRFALNNEQRELNQSTADPATSPTVMAPFGNTISDRGEWDWSDVIITPPMEATDGGNVGSHDTFDSFQLYLCGDHIEQGSDYPSLRFEAVGMIQSYLENQKAWAIPGEEQVVQPENPLAFARLSEMSSMRLTEEVSDEQKQSPPYSNDDDDDAMSVFATTTLSGNVETAFPSVTTNDTIVVAPGGVAKIMITNNHRDGDGNIVTSFPFVRVNIVEL